jgi:TolB-like protein/Flp pilus assembly protein TadD
LTASDVFLSYNREDQAVARRFAEGFEREGLTVWWDATLRSGEAYDEVTEQALRDAKAVVVLWSKRSVASRWVRAEATLADRNRTLVPAMIEACERPIMFELTQTADLSQWSGAANDRTWLAFLTDVRRFVRTGGAETASLSPAVATIPTRSSGKDERPSLAILPFTNRSGERTDDVFADGMVEDLILALSLSGRIKVIAQSATVVYRRNVSDLRTIGRDLGVRYLLEGNVRRVGQNLRVTAQLVEGENGTVLWSQKFDRPLTELAELQEQLVTEVAAQLGDQVERVEIEKALAKPGDLTAWEAVTRVFAGITTINPVSIRTSIAEARKALALAPDYAMGHAALAVSLALKNARDGGSEALRREARQHIERALTLGASDPTVLGWTAHALAMCGAWPEALQYAERVVSLNPNVAIGRLTLAMVCVRLKRIDDVLMHVSALESLAPRGYMTHNGMAFRGIAHYMAGRYKEARKAMEQALLLNPGFVYPFKDIAVVCEKTGQHEEARDAVRRLRSADPTITLEDMEAFNLSSLFPPDVAVEFNTIFRKVWEATPVESPA